MRITTTALLSLVATGCMPTIEHRHHESPDAGVEEAAPCTDIVTKHLDLTVTGEASFNGLPQTCWYLDGKLTLRGPAVTSLAKLGDLRRVRDLEIDSTALVHVDSVSPIDVSGSIYIHHNNQLVDIAKVAPQGQVDGIRVDGNQVLTSLGGLGSVTLSSDASNAANVSITNNPKLASAALMNLQRIDGALTISDNPLITEVHLHALTSVHDVTISRNAALTGVMLPQLQFVHGTLTIDSNASLTSLADSMTSTIETVDLTVAITNNPKLTDLGNFAHTGYVTGAVNLNGNSSLSVCKAQEVQCCVNTGGVTYQGVLNQNCPTHSWCWSQQNGCPF